MRRHELTDAQWEQLAALLPPLKRYRRVATRDEKQAVTYLTMVTIACILEWL